MNALQRTKNTVSRHVASIRRPAAALGAVATFMALAAPPAAAQVAAVTDMKNNTAAVEVRNPSARPQTVEVALHHGDVVDGRLVLGEPVDAIVGPRSFRLEPQAHQTVRVLLRETVRPGTVLRLVTTLTPVQDTSDGSGQSGSRIVLATRLITKLIAH